MKKAIVIGCPGSGKTTFAEKLSKITGLPLFYLDAIWHKPDRTHIPREEFDERLAEINKLDEWIIDGNYSRTIEVRLQMCDTVFLFDLPTEVCIQGAISRLGKDRYDVPWIDTELDPVLKKNIEEFSCKTLPYIYQLLEKYKDREIIVFKSRIEADEYILRRKK
ncbi:MAG: adenylate kinase [Clostridia bacterium]|nr:adenylate kinase [Clostridia bacterium]